MAKRLFVPMTAENTGDKVELFDAAFDLAKEAGLHITSAPRWIAHPNPDGTLTYGYEFDTKPKESE